MDRFVRGSGFEVTGIMDKTVSVHGLVLHVMGWIGGIVQTTRHEEGGCGGRGLGL